jgi:hypothetical protein
MGIFYTMDSTNFIKKEKEPEDTHIMKRMLIGVGVFAAFLAITLITPLKKL